MHPQELRDALQRRPFHPFFVFASDGSSFPVRHPELCVPGRRSVIIAWSETDQAEVTFDRYAVVPWDHLSHLEDLPDGAGKKKSKK